VPKAQRWKEILDSKCKKFQIFSINSVFVQYKKEFSQATNSSLSHSVELAWKKAIFDASYSNSCIPYDAPKFRLAGVNFDDRKVFLKIGLTSYKNYIAHRTDVGLRSLTRSIAKKKKMPVFRFLPNVIGNAAIVQTTDRQIIIIKRSHHVSSYKNYFDLPGGHPEPSRIDAFSNHENNRCKSIENQIRNELFDSIRHEVQDEIGLPMVLLGQPKLLTILVNLCDVMTPDIVFLQPVDLTAEKIKHDFLKHKKRNREIQKFIIFDLKNIKATEFLKQTPIMEGAFAVIKAMNGLLGAFL